MSIPTSQFIPPATSPLGIHTFVLYICVSISALQIRLSDAFFKIPHKSNVIHLLFFLTYFTLIFSRSIHVSANGTTSFLFVGWVIEWLQFKRLPISNVGKKMEHLKLLDETDENGMTTLRKDLEIPHNTIYTLI